MSGDRDLAGCSDHCEGLGGGREGGLSLVVTLMYGVGTSCRLLASTILELYPLTSCPEPHLPAFGGRVEDKAPGLTVSLFPPGQLGWREGGAAHCPLLSSPRDSKASPAFQAPR